MRIWWGVLRDLLQRDTEAAQGVLEMVPPLPLVAVEACQTTRLAGSFAPSHIELATDVAATYLDLTIINQKLHARELFKATHQNAPDYNSRRAAINRDVGQTIDYLLDRLQKHRKDLGDDLR